MSGGPLKTESVPNSMRSSTRLQGFKVPRDLSLGASKTIKDSTRGALSANKKVFTPNLNVTRNRTTSSSSTDSTPSKGRTSRDGRPERGRGRGSLGAATRGRGKTCIQSVGLFSEGFAQQPLRRSQARPSYNEGVTARKPILSKKRDEENLAEQLADTCEDDDAAFGFDTLEVEDDFNVPVVLREAKSRTDVQEVCEYPSTLKDFFSRSTAQLFLIQLPDTLPGEGNEQVEPKKSEKAELESKGVVNQEQNYCLMRGLQEGLIGKFIRYKSGKTKLVLGNTRFDADLGLEPGFLQEVVSVQTNAHERNGNIINLGKVNAKVNVSPDWEEMFQNMDTS